MKPGDVVLVELSGIGGAGRKLRPALFLAELPGKFQKILLCGISTRLDTIETDWDELMDPKDTDFSASGLHKTSTVRLSYLFAVHPNEICGGIGRMADDRLLRLRDRLSNWLRSDLLSAP